MIGFFVRDSSGCEPVFLMGDLQIPTMATKYNFADITIIPVWTKLFALFTVQRFGV